jgi:TM2 domain-containing membrane protein YozV
MEHTGRIWLGDDDPSTATLGTVEVTDDARIVLQLSGRQATEWAPNDVEAIGDNPVTTLTIGDEAINFEPDDLAAWNEDIAGAQMWARLQTSAVGDIEVSAESVEAGSAAIAQGGAQQVGGSFCRACGEQIDPRAEICVHCGVRQYALVTRPHKSKTTAGLLALFLGGFGAHHFYLGNIGLGILYLLFFWTFIPAIVAFFEALVFFFQSDASFDAKYNSVSIIV